MTNPYPLPRELRQTEAFYGDGGSSYGPFGFKVFDIDDVKVFARPDNGPRFLPATAVVAKVNGDVFDSFTIVFPANVPATTEIVVISQRLQERAAGVSKGTRLDMSALEKQLSVDGTILQELRRDLSRSVMSDFGDAPLTIDVDLADGDVLMRQGDRLVKGPNAAEIGAAEGYAESARADRELAETAAELALSLVPTVFAINRAAIKSLNPLLVASAYLKEAGRRGTFLWQVGDYSAQIAADPLEGMYLKGDGIPATVGAWVRQFDGAFYARWCGSGQAAIEGAHALASSIVIDQAFSITATRTWPNGKNYLFIEGGKLAVSTGVVLTIRGIVHGDTWQGIPSGSASQRKLFDCAGTGRVVGLRLNRPGWWGATPGVSSFDSSPAFNAASLSVDASALSDGGRPTIEIGTGFFYFGSTWTVRPTATINLIVGGAGVIFNGSRLIAMPVFAGTWLFHADGNADPTECISDYRISDFCIEASSNPNVSCFLAGSIDPAKKLIGYQKSKISNILTLNGASGIDLSHIRLVDIDGCSAWMSGVSVATSCLRILNSGGFTGDLDFNRCQFVNRADIVNSSLVSIISANGPFGGDTNYIAGVRFNSGCIFYAAHVRFVLYVANGAGLSDVFVNAGCQFDGSSACDFRLTVASATGRLRSVHILDNWIAGSNLGSGNNQIEINGRADNNIRDIFVQRVFSNGPRGKFLNADNVTGLFVEGNDMTEIANPAGPAIQVTTCTSFRIGQNTINNMNPSDKVQTMVTVVGGCDFYQVRGNTGKPHVTGLTVNDSGSGSNKSVGDNI